MTSKDTLLVLVIFFFYFGIPNAVKGGVPAFPAPSNPTYAT